MFFVLPEFFSDIFSVEETKMLDEVIEFFVKKKVGYALFNHFHDTLQMIY